MAETGFSEQGDGRWSLSGTLDFETVPALLGRVPAVVRTAGPVEIDLQAVTRADSAGLALLIECLRAADRSGNAVHFVNVPQQLLSIARVSGLQEILSLPAVGPA